MRASASNYGDLPGWIKNMGSLYLAFAIILFLLNIGHSRVKAPSSLARKRSHIVLMGSLLAFGLPVAHLIVGMILKRPLFPYAMVVNLALYLLFPLTVGYAIAKHNLFDVDVFIKRTVGFGLMTLVVGALYVSLAASIKPTISFFPSLEKISGIYPVLFALLVLFLFHPLRNRLQRAVDRLFYRENIDYKTAVLSLSDRLTTVLELNEVVIRILHVVRDVMSIDSAGVILLESEAEECPALFIHDVPDEDREYDIEEDCLDLEDPIVSLMIREKKMITKYDIAEGHGFGGERDIYAQRFQNLRSTMALPLIFQNKVTGILVLGRKKSGQFYTREDVDLLITLAAHGAIAVENAKRAEKMKDEELVRANLARYLSPQVVEQVVNKNMNMDLGGGRKTVAVLISDIRGFTELTKAQPPDRLAAILNEYFTEMSGIIFDNQGSLDKYVGDAIVAVFGSLIDLENPTANAVKAAIDMINSMARLNEKWFEKFDGLTMNIGIGIDLGEVFLGNVGSPERMEFTVIGEAVNMADQLSNMAKPNQILLSVAADAAKGGKIDVVVRQLQLEGVKGKEGTQKILEVVN